MSQRSDIFEVCSDYEVLRRLMGKVRRDARLGCWIWHGHRDGHGYGVVSWRATSGARHRAGAHRLAYEVMVDAIPLGLVVDHLCHEPSCVNPDHLRVTDRATNSLWNYSPSTTATLTGYCESGRHELTPENAWIHPTNGSRRCRRCRNEGLRTGQVSRLHRTDVSTTRLRELRASGLTYQQIAEVVAMSKAGVAKRLTA